MFPQELPEHDWGSKEGYLEDGQFASDRLLKKRKRMGVVHYLVEWRGAPARPQRARSRLAQHGPRAGCLNITGCIGPYCTAPV